MERKVPPSVEKFYGVRAMKWRARGSASSTYSGRLSARVNLGYAIPLPGTYLYAETIIRAGQTASPFSTACTEEIKTRTEASCNTYPTAPARMESKNARSVSGIPTKITFSDGAAVISFLSKVKSDRAASNSSRSTTPAPEESTACTLPAFVACAPTTLNSGSARKPASTLHATMDSPRPGICRPCLVKRCAWFLNGTEPPIARK
jgi:hypothetical protein